MLKKIGIFGGAFDPIHYGHINLISECLKAVSLDEIIVIPCGNPPHKTLLTSSFHRLNMCNLALNDFGNVSISDFEIKSNQITYTYKTLGYIKQQYSDCELFLIIGYDQVEKFFDWKEPHIILHLSKIIACSRVGVEIDKSKYDFVHSFINFKSDISSSKIRQYVKEGKDIKNLTPVYDYILNNNFYK